MNADVDWRSYSIITGPRWSPACPVPSTWSYSIESVLGRHGPKWSRPHRSLFRLSPSPLKCSWNPLVTRWSNTVRSVTVPCRRVLTGRKHVISRPRPSPFKSGQISLYTRWSNAVTVRRRPPATTTILEEEGVQRGKETRGPDTASCGSRPSEKWVTENMSIRYLFDTKSIESKTNHFSLGDMIVK